MNMKPNVHLSIFSLEIAVALFLSQAILAHGYITFPAATAAIRKLPGFESASLSAPADVNSFSSLLCCCPLSSYSIFYSISSASHSYTAIPDVFTLRYFFPFASVG